MIEVKDLRIGNHFKWSELASMGSDYGKVDLDNIKYHQFFEPIKLTEEILLKCGFEKEGEWGVVYFNPRMGIRFYNFNSGECDIIQDDKFIAFKQGHIKYLHTLQNLYYALTGKELEINL